MVRSSIDRVLRSRLVSHLVSPRSADDYVQLFDPSWSSQGVRARVVAIRSEQDDATSLLLEPNRNWRGFRAGQFVRLGVPVGGAWHARSFSISSAPADGYPLRITIKSVPRGRVSGWAKRGACVGDVLTMSQAHGDFVLPEPLPPRLLFISGGSGITPIVSMVRELAAGGYGGEIAWLHFARVEAMFADEVARLLAGNPRIRLSVQQTRGDGVRAGAPHFSREKLEVFAPDWSSSEAFVCGPDALSRSVARLWEAESPGHPLHVERFVPPAAPARAPVAEGTCRLTFSRSRRVVEGRPGVSLLEQAEAAGLSPKHGCRMGICRSCICRKVSGTVRDESSGRSSGDADQEVRLCVTTPLSDVTLDL